MCLDLPSTIEYSHKKVNVNNILERREYYRNHILIPGSYIPTIRANLIFLKQIYMELVLTFYVVKNVIQIKIKFHINLFMQYLHPTTKNIRILDLLFKKYMINVVASLLQI
jgi:hypothetical protein